MTFTVKVALVGGLLISFIFDHSSIALDTVAMTEICERLQERTSSELHLEFEPRDVVRETPRWRTTLSSQGSWGDINYSDRSVSNWTTVDHLRRTAALGKMHYAAEAERALRFWLSHRFRSDNWWWNQLYLPRILSSALLLSGREFSSLTPEQQAEVRSVYAGIGSEMSGQNRIWQAEALLGAACVMRDPATLILARDYYAREFVAQSSEGVQSDYSYHQHGPLIYNGGYGLNFALDSLRALLLFQGTPLEFPANTREFLLSFVFEGTAWMFVGSQFDFGVIGREIARPGKDTKLLSRVFQLAQRIDRERSHRWAPLLQNSLGQQSHPFGGAKNFYKSDFFVWKNAASGSHISVRGASPRVFRNDGVWGGGEGLLSHLLADGAHAIMRTGEEYRDFVALWDWNRIPGVTALFSNRARTRDEVRTPGEQRFVGGLSEGGRGLFAMRFSRSEDELEARKGYFFFDGGLIALGAGVTSRKDGWVATSLEQSRAMGEIRASVDSCLPRDWIERGDTRLPASNFSTWFLHNQIGYVPGPSLLGVRVSVETVHGNWRSVSVPAGNVPVFGDRFQLGLEHGQRPAGEKYSYAILPGVSEQDLQQHWCGASNRLRKAVVHNVHQFQVVVDPVLGANQSVQVIFWEPAEFTTPFLGQSYLQIRSDSALVLQLRKLTEGSVRLSFADPSQRLRHARLRLRSSDRVIRCEGCEVGPEGTQLTLQFPGHPQLGDLRFVDLRIGE